MNPIREYEEKHEYTQDEVLEMKIMVDGFSRNYEIRIRSLRELVSDCDPQIGERAVRIERDLKISLKNNEISQEDVSRFQDQLDEQMSIFGFECQCKKRTLQ